MSDDTTTSRVLALLSLLQTRRLWPGTELAGRLGVSGRTLRRDVERLRTLGYRVYARRGQVGGYQLAPGADLPPLVLSDEEAVTLAVSLRNAAVNGPSVGLPETAITVLAKLEQVLPRRLQRRVGALRSATVTLAPPAGDFPAADPDTLVVLALACRDRQRVRFDYRAADGTRTAREVEPAAIVGRARRWYLVCWDLTRHAWRTLRVDRIGKVTDTGTVFASRELPAGDVEAFVAGQFDEQPLYRAEVVIHTPIEQAARHLGGYARGLRADGPDHTRWPIQAERLQTLVGALAWLPWDYTVSGSPELTVLLRDTAARMTRAGGE